MNRNTKWLHLFMVFGLVLSLLVGCSSSAVEQGKVEQTTAIVTAQETKPSTVKQGDSFPVTLIDAGGEEIVIQKRPERIASVTLGTDEILLSLVEKNRLIAVTEISTDPGISNVAGQTDDIPNKIQKANAEQIIALKPDLVFVASYTSEDVVKQLKDAGLTVFKFQFFDSIDRMKENVITIGKTVGELEKAERIVADMDARLASISEKVEKIKDRPTVLYYTPHGYTAGKGTTIDDIIMKAGGKNLAAEVGIESWKELSLEKVVEMNPDIILLSAWNPKKPNFIDELRKNPALENVEAVKSNRVYAVSGAHITTVSQYIVDGVEDVFEVIHP
jgi:iron complex transport system substrate-binding protein